MLRAILLEVPGAQFCPQVWIGNIGRVDLVDEARRVAVEADSFEFHANSAAFAEDMVRYNALVNAGYLVLRFAWKHVMFEQDYVREVVTAAIRAQERSVRRCTGCVAG